MLVEEVLLRETMLVEEVLKLVMSLLRALILLMGKSGLKAKKQLSVISDMYGIIKQLLQMTFSENFRGK